MNTIVLAEVTATRDFTNYVGGYGVLLTLKLKLGFFVAAFNIASYIN